MITGYTIRSTPNVIGDRRTTGRYKTKSEARKQLEYIKKNRDNMSGVGFNNPRIKKIRMFA